MGHKPSLTPQSRATRTSHLRLATLVHLQDIRRDHVSMSSIFCPGKVHRPLWHRETAGCPREPVWTTTGKAKVHQLSQLVSTPRVVVCKSSHGFGLTDLGVSNSCSASSKRIPNKPSSEPFFFLGPHPQHMEVPRLGDQSELYPPAYITATVTPDPSPVRDPYHSSRQRQIPNPLSKTRDQTCFLMDAS